MSLRSTRETVSVLGNAPVPAAVRATRQAVEVLAAARLPEPLRMTRQVVEVLALDPDSSINLEGSDTLTFGQSVGLVRTLNLSASSVLALADESTFTPNHFELAASNTLTVADSAGVSTNHISLSASNTLEITDDADGGAWTPIYLAASNVLEMNSGPLYSRTSDAEAESELALSQAAGFSKSRMLSASSALDLVGGCHTTRRLGLASSSELTISQALAFSVVRSAILENYSPLVGEGIGSAPASSIEGLNPGVTDPFRLVYPGTGTITDSITLRSPEFGNRDRLAFNRILRETRGGTLIVYADPVWPKIETFLLTFTGLSHAKATSLISFVQTHLGQEVGMLDWETRYWVGVITAPEESIVEDAADSCTVSLEFRGQPGTWTP